MDAKLHAQNRSAFWLSVFTVAYNLIEGAVSVGFAWFSGSSALLGFGADSFIESLSGAVMIWRFWKPEGAIDREHRAAVLVGTSFLILAAYVAFEAVSGLMEHTGPTRSIVPIAIAVLSLIVMPTLFLLKRRTAESLNSRSLLADSKQTLACLMLSVALLVGAGLHYYWGIWQADPIAGFVIAAYLVKEGCGVIRSGETCAC